MYELSGINHTFKPPSTRTNPFEPGGIYSGLTVGQSIQQLIRVEFGTA